MYKVKMSDYTSMRTGGWTNARIITSVDNLKYNGALIIGRGTNVLFSDVDYDGEVWIMRNDRFTVNGNLVRAESGVSISRLARTTASMGLSGLQWACGIPGSVGGAVVMNAGAYGGECLDNLLNIRMLTEKGELLLTRDELTPSHRKTLGLPNGVILDATFRLISDSKATEKINNFDSLRRKAQPSGRTLGSTFKKVGNKSAGQIIEDVGLKGLSVGKSFVSDKHANFIINEGDSSADVRSLIDIIKLRVYARTGIKLEEEIIYAGEF